MKDERRKAEIVWGFLVNKKYPFFVNFNGWNEGSGWPIETKEKINLRIKELFKEHSKKYRIKVRKYGGL